MLEIISYLLFFSLLISIIIYFYIKLKFGFWVSQPVFHVYDFLYLIKNPGIINNHLPEKNKYTNFKNIETILFSNISLLQKQRFTNLIQKNYLQNKNNIFNPEFENIFPYFSGHNDKVFFSFYREDYFLLNKKNGKVINEKKIVGTITSRPIYVVINNGNKDAKFVAYYVDYLCIDKLYRKKGIAQQLIQTHHYNQSYINKNIVVSLFKREDELTGIVPLCIYKTYGFNVTTWREPLNLSGNYKILEINSSNFHFLFNFINENSKKFEIIINTEISNMIELIKTKNIFIYTIVMENTIICAYFFRKSCVQVEKGIEVLSCFASINNTEDDLFIQGFKISFWKISVENFFGFAAIEEISDNYLFINNIKLKTKPIIISPTAYFFYNFAYSTFHSHKVLIIN
jgi:hypothetical protein